MINIIDRLIGKASFKPLQKECLDDFADLLIIVYIKCNTISKEAILKDLISFIEKMGDMENDLIRHKEKFNLKF